MLLKCAALCDLYNVENTHNVSLQCGKHQQSHRYRHACVEHSITKNSL